MNIGQWDGTNHRIEADSNRPLKIYSYNTSGGIALGISGSDKLTINGNGSGVAIAGTLTVGNSSIGSNSSHLANITINNNGYIGTTYDSTSLNFTTAGDLVATGKLGIGTPVNTAPSAKLEISGFSTGAGLKLNYGNSSGTIEAVNFIANGGANGVIGMQMVSAGVGDLWLGGSGGRSLTLYRNGNVGIGTTGPTLGKLEVQDGTGGADKTVAHFGAHIYGEPSYTTYINLGTEYGDGTSRIGSINTTGNQSSLVFETHAAASGSFTERMRIDNNGNVGIGTTTPAHKLSITDTTSTSIAYQRTGVSAKKWGFHTDNDNTYWQNITDNVLALTIKNNGNVGIGTTAQQKNSK